MNQHELKKWFKQAEQEADKKERNKGRKVFRPGKTAREKAKRMHHGVEAKG
jgi:hypothetical protein